MERELAEGDDMVVREGDLIAEDGVGRVLPRLEVSRGVGEDELEPGRELVPEGRRLVLRLGMQGSSEPVTAFW